MRWFRLEPPRDKAGINGAPYDRENLGSDLQKIWRLARNERVLLSCGLTFLLVAAGFRVLIPQAVASTLVVAIGPGTSAAGVHASLSSAARTLTELALGYGVASGLRGLTMSIVENRLLSRLRRQTFARVLQQDIAFHDERSVGELTSRLSSDCEAVSSGLSMNFNILLRSAVQVIFGTCYLAYTSWRLSLLLLGVWGVLFFVYTTFGRFTRRASLIRQDALAGLNTMATEALQNVRTVRAVGGEPTMLNKYREASARLIFIEHQRAAAYGLYVMFYGSLTESIKAVALGAGGLLVGKGLMGPEQLAASMLYIDSVVGSSLSVGGQYRQLMQSIGSSRRVFEYTEMPPSPSVLHAEEGGGRRVAPEELRASVRFRGVAFAYPSRPEEPVLRGLDLELAPGSTTALVGSSGSGKSTVAALLQRWYEPDAGEVLLDGLPLRDLDPAWLRSLFGFVTQDPRLFSASVLDNIVFGLGDAGSGAGRAEAELLEGRPLASAGGGGGEAGPGVPGPELAAAARAAAEAAGAHEFVEALPDGYHTMVGDVRLSGGQRQRIALARALVRRPRILVLDEATSALDRKTEAAVQASVEEYVQAASATCLVIAHRLSTVASADRIVVMDGGRVAEQGTHRELLERQGPYSRLVRGGR